MQWYFTQCTNAHTTATVAAAVDDACLVTLPLPIIVPITPKKKHYSPSHHHRYMQDSTNTGYHIKTNPMKQVYRTCGLFFSLPRDICSHIIRRLGF